MDNLLVQQLTGLSEAGIKERNDFMSKVTVMWTGIYEDPYDRWYKEDYRQVCGNALSLTDEYICVVCPEWYEDTDRVAREIDPDKGKKIRELVHVVCDEHGNAHLEPYWATPYSRNLPEGYRWSNSGALVKIGFRKGLDTGLWYKNEVIFLPLYDLIDTDSGRPVSRDELGLDQMWEEYVPDFWEELEDEGTDEDVCKY